MELLEQAQRSRVVLLTGKGGVGRTTVAAALAQAASRAGRRVLLAELGDPDGNASPLARLFGRERLAPEPQPLGERLQGCSVWAPLGHARFFADVLPGGALLGAAIRSRALQSFLASAPSFMEMGWLYHVLSLLRARGPGGGWRYDLLVLDMPATGHTLALTSMPDILLRLITKGPLVTALREGHAMLKDPAHTSAWVVTLPEALPVTEALELLAGLAASAVPIGGVLLNRLPADPFSADEHAAVIAALDGQPILGRLAFERITRSRLEVERLRAATRLPLALLGEHVQRGPALVEALAQELTADAGHAPARPPPPQAPRPA